jgi:hypothetical protein
MLCFTETFVVQADVSIFHRDAVADTCAVWNVLASPRLTRAARVAGCVFNLTTYVLYECLHKPRKEEVAEDRELQRRLSAARTGEMFKSHALSLADLQDVARLEARKRLGKGELSCIAFARRTGLAFLTDDTGAKKLGLQELDGGRVQSSPHLFGWLVFAGHISDAEVDPIVTEHASMRRHRGEDFRRNYLEALRIRLLLQTPAPSTSGT